ncbi:sensor histidine kinase [Lichenibacterium dinghuense]|uniref:sensor histidine kinase n=1 Tax=Lichenibacterium dinghuense TaxID=2895977 RepID=UPI001F20DE73|nr:HAMP domain-containing sensor histidine kinase [Lichenibacterium sp. 6Y81]
MQESRDRDDEAEDVGAAFADPAFAGLKARGAPFAILRPAAGEVVWANAAAAAFWDAGTAAELARALLGAEGDDGWLDGLLRGLVPGRAPRLARAGLARGFRMRAHTALIRAWTDRGGATLVGFGVPDAAPGGGAWDRPAWARDEPVAEEPASDEPRGAADHGAGEGEISEEDAPEGDGPTLARRGQLAVLRDRLSRTLDGATTLRTLWRTDAGGVLTAIDENTFARLGSPLRLDGRALPDAVAPFDPAGSERLRAALEGRATWAGLPVELPVADGAAAVPLALSGSPVFGADRAFAGFRGFGTIDLGRLTLAPRRTPAVEAEAPPTREPAATPPEVAPPPPEPAPAEPAAAEEAPRPAPPANVVHLRAFQAAASGRFGAVQVPTPARTDDIHPDGHAEAEGSAGPPAAGEEAGPAEDGPLSDQMAFLALGEALRARIGAPPAAEPVETAGAAVESPADQQRVTGVDERASALLDLLPAGVLATVGERPVFANPAASARLGYGDARDLLAAAGPVAVPSAEADRIALRDAKGETVLCAARRAEVPWGNGTASLWLLAEPEPPEAGGEEAYAGPVASDAKEDRSVELLDRVDDAVALLDAAGRLRRLNRRGEGWFGRRDPEAPARSLADLLAPESRLAATALLGEVRDQRDGLGAPPLRRDVVARTGEGAPVPMLLTVGRLGASGFYATLRDVSALQGAEADRARSERDRARSAGRLPDLLAKVSHEIRTPLGAILGFAEVMMDERFGPLGNPRYKDYLKDIHTSGAQVVALVDDLLDLSRIEAGQLDLEVAAVDINRVVTEAVAQMQPEAHRERVIMRTSLAGRIPSVLADERSARQIVKNLLSNAVKFNEPGGQVIVSTAPADGEGVLLRVRDTGVGMSDEAIAAALEPFGGFSERAPAQGNGLGLPLTRALVGANGASMTIRSRPREGTLVEVFFAPAGEEEARRPA